MAEEVKAVHREPHPFIGVQQIMNFVGRPVAFVGKIDRFEDNTMFIKTHEGKYLCLPHLYEIHCILLHFHSTDLRLGYF